MPAVAEQEKQERQYEYASGDDAILIAHRYDPLITIDQMMRLVPRRAKKRDSYYYRARALRQLGYLLQLTKVRRKGDGQLWLDVTATTLTEVGWSRVHSLGASTPPKGFNLATLKKNVTPGTWIETNKNFDHDRKLTDLHLRFLDELAEAEGELLTWEPLAAYVGIYMAEGNLIPDRFVVYQTPGFEPDCAYIEMENADPSSDNGLQSIEKKCSIYESYLKSGRFEERWGHQNFRVLFFMRTEAMAYNQCLRMQNDGGIYNSRRWYFTWPGAGKLTEQIFMTPKDFHKGELYSLTD